MKVFYNVSAQKVSWVKSNKNALELNSDAISNLYYPESIEELVDVINSITQAGEEFDLIGHSSNTLFLPSYHVKHLICIRELTSWYETDSEIVCDCGVNVALLSKEMISMGYEGFEGLNDLPGTIAGAVYGNSGCRNCSVNDLVTDIELLTKDGICHIGRDELKLSFRSSSLKRKELDGVIISVRLEKRKGDAQSLREIADKNHEFRKNNQPNGANNLGSTFDGGKCPTIKGKLLGLFEKCIRLLTLNRNPRLSYLLMLRCIGKACFVPYVYKWNRYMFLDEYSHELFPQYVQFVCSLYKDARLEIEIRK